MNISSNTDRQQGIVAMKQKVRAVIPNIPYLSAEQFTALESKKQEHPLFLIDVRTSEENAVSTIQGAVSYSKARDTLKQMKTSGSENAPHVICFCTVGLRSGLYARQIKQQGYKVSNYSIMEHLNGDGQLVKDDGTTWQREVHSYDNTHRAFFPSDCQFESFSTPVALFRALQYIPSFLSALVARVMNSST